ncbi:deoxynucleoside kinase [[Acholeplasma] multilocale]|uniref:deoxynucleoside kinase n=1 Tax=[Acholeplasma] multilocale TaxID=264638 RepID=UPI00047B9BA6|nr:deoxynucleoside kinase [[Acholeplasma] multilocale]
MKIAIFGTVGAGKTTLIDTLKKKLPQDYKVFWEPLQDNPYFEDSYSPDKAIRQSAAYKMELLMLSNRMKQFKESKQYENVIYDRGIMDTIIFAHWNYEEGNIDEKDWNVYREYFELVVLPSIFAQKGQDGYDLVVYLKVSPQTSIKRITNRAIERELNVNTEFWTKLTNMYDRWYKYLENKFPFLVVDGNIENPEVYADEILSVMNKSK